MIKNNKKIYVNGGIVIDTPFFRYNDAKCLCSTPPPKAVNRSNVTVR